MRKHRIRTTALAATVLAAALSLTACQDTDAETGAKENVSSEVPADNAGSDASEGSGTSKDSGAAKGSDTSEATDTSEAAASGNASGSAAEGSGDKSGYGQVCGANDISWSTRSETQAGGYILIIAKANPGITCVLPAALPTVAFGSDGTEAGPAEQAVGEAITLSGSTTAYAGVNPKTTKDNGGKELDSIVVAVGNTDPNPVSLPVDTITVEDPIVTNWHTSAADAVPFSS
ncbi:hypothetical protein KQY30_19590 [Streptomyces sp. GMY02]|uniref:DUF4232 domain-containing protein n=1 Tax=Streptomyces sp. GMY02 TaxID=1333528 RepID=UPI001C2BF228|nr:DUF4232 domain-containing protein [Streptomyces sp. GMY02]QXE36113.1 hypothetical protein KQY30_19590 [Streptomyces sp. GMY02]